VHHPKHPPVNPCIAQKPPHTPKTPNPPLTPPTDTPHRQSTPPGSATCRSNADALTGKIASHGRPSGHPTASQTTETLTSVRPRAKPKTTGRWCGLCGGGVVWLWWLVGCAALFLGSGLLPCLPAWCCVVLGAAGQQRSCGCLSGVRLDPFGMPRLRSASVVGGHPGSSAGPPSSDSHAGLRHGIQWPSALSRRRTPHTGGGLPARMPARGCPQRARCSTATRLQVFAAPRSICAARASGSARFWWRGMRWLVFSLSKWAGEYGGRPSSPAQPAACSRHWDAWRLPAAAPAGLPGLRASSQQSQFVRGLASPTHRGH